MNDLVAMSPISTSPLLDLASVARRSRLQSWMGAAASLFPEFSVGLADSCPSTGAIRSIPFGPGQALSILSPPALVQYRPSRDCGRVYDSVSLVVQLRGSMTLTHRRREAPLVAGDACVIDGHLPFTMQVTGAEAEILVLQLPRDLAVGSQPLLEHGAGERLDGGEPGVALLRDFVLQTLRRAPCLTYPQCVTALGAIAKLLALPLQERADDGLDRRVRNALAYIENRVCDPELDADEVALNQRMSRRRLDQLCLATVGQTLSGQIWQRRLLLAEAMLCDASRARTTVTQIALAVGFKSPSHFTRAFRRRHGTTPLQWRRQGAAVTVPDCDWRH